MDIKTIGKAAFVLTPLILAMLKKQENYSPDYHSEVEPPIQNSMIGNFVYGNMNQSVSQIYGSATLANTPII